MESNKKGIRLKHKENFVDGIVNFFKRDDSDKNKTPEKIILDEGDNHSPRSVSPAGNRKKIFKKNIKENSFQQQGFNLQNNYEITFNQNQRNKNFNTLQYQKSTGMSPIRQVHHQQSQISRLILDTSKNNNDPYRQTSMTSYKNPLQRPVYPSNESIINQTHQQSYYQNNDPQDFERIKHMTRQIQKQQKQIEQLKQEVFSLRQYKQLSEMQIKSLKQEVHRLQRLNKILQDNQYKGQNYLNEKEKQKQKQKFNDYSDFTQSKKQKSSFNIKDSLPILPQVANQFRHNQRSKISDVQVEENSIRNLNLKKSDPKINTIEKNRRNYEIQNVEEIVSPFMTTSSYQKTVKPRHQENSEISFKKQNKFAEDEGRISKTIGRFSNLQPVPQVKYQNQNRRQNQNNYESGTSGKFSQSLLSYSESSKKSSNSRQQFIEKSKSQQIKKQKPPSQQQSLRINDSKLFNFQDFDGGQSFQQAGYF